MRAVQYKRHPQFVNWSSFLFGAVALFLLVSSFFIPVQNAVNERVPLVYGLVENELIFSWTDCSALLGVLLASVLLLHVYMLSRPITGSRSERLLAVCLAAALLFTNPRAVYFSPIYFSALCLIWAQFCLLGSKFFTAFFLIALAALFYAPIIWIAPVVMILLVSDGQYSHRTVIKGITGILTPFFLLLSLRYILFEDMMEFCQMYLEEISSISAVFFSSSIAYLLLVFIVTVIATHLLVVYSGHSKNMGIAEAYTLKTYIIYEIVVGVLFFLFAGSSTTPLSVLAASPIAILFARFLYKEHAGNAVIIEFIMLLCAFIIVRMEYFIR